ncbi:HlyD family secretion protein [Nonlabens xiamenensis]|uniref:HlyD family secretion protein n=1 Tax=Nonlabens xiamenensis TaxID=2341043 RepID=UPI000F60F523|nr:biotin/lipoyl-binding protein [Nonlabens xiamenensis]
MLNISKNTLSEQLDIMNFDAGRRVMKRRHYRLFNRFLGGFAIFSIVLMFFPWTQTVISNGNVTTLTPAQRPLTLQSPIAGRIEQWYVREGDQVKRGDTVLRISEVKSEYFDPNLVARTDQQIEAKSRSVQSYEQKVQALGSQIAALSQEQQLKLEQARNKLIQSRLKVKSDSIDLEAARTDYDIAQTRLTRFSTLEAEGFKSTTEVEEKKLNARNAQAKVISQEQKLLQAKNEVINAEIELNRIRQEYAEKMSKARSDQLSAESGQLETEAAVSKLQSDRTNYQIRNDMYFVTAPQDGFINKAIKAGIGETFKDGEPLVNIMPVNYDLAVETFVEPLDLPLMHVGEDVRVRFDGWPAIVFSGWPNASYGTYGAKVVAVETFISNNGKYRILLAPNEQLEPWPDALRPGSGARTIALLEDVPVWYELWRKLNGFPPNYYQPDNQNQSSDANKK